MSSWILPLLLKLPKPLLSLGRLISSYLREQSPLLVWVSMDEARKMPRIHLCNCTKDIPVHIHCVAISCGVPDRAVGIYFGPPQGRSLSLSPKEKIEMSIDLWRDLSVVIRETWTKEMQTGDVKSECDQFGVVRAIISSPKDQSWVRVDFNEHQRRKYCQGGVQWVIRRMVDIASPQQQELVFNFDPAGNEADVQAYSFEEFQEQFVNWPRDQEVSDAASKSFFGALYSNSEEREQKRVQFVEIVGNLKRLAVEYPNDLEDHLLLRDGQLKFSEYILRSVHKLTCQTTEETRSRSAYLSREVILHFANEEKRVSGAHMVSLGEHQKMPSPPMFHYTSSEFAADMGFWSGKPPPNWDMFLSYFEARYADKREAAWKAIRLWSARAALSTHRAAFEEFIKLTPEGTSWSSKLMEALWRYYAPATDEQTLRPPDAALICQMAKGTV